jgi:two-component SAPR family response regulator
MPQINGYELGKKIKEIDSNIKVILISDYDDRLENTFEFNLFKNQ